jgi:hypothetical protein
VSYVLNGKNVTREEFLAGAPGDGLKSPPRTANTYRGHDPLISDGLGCMKAQVPELRDVIREHGIKGVVVRDSGQLEITSRRGRAELCKVRGLADKDGGFGDSV